MKKKKLSKDTKELLVALVILYGIISIPILMIGLMDKAWNNCSVKYGDILFPARQLGCLLASPIVGK
jgi:hypothetical protein